MLASTQHCPKLLRPQAHSQAPTTSGRRQSVAAYGTPSYPALIVTSSSASEERPRLLHQQQTGALIRSLDSSARRDRTHVQPNPRR
jgi:hypothetical protein